MATPQPLPEPTNPIGIDGLEFVEYATAKPQEFGALLEKLGFAAIARHRSREVMLYRQGGMNLIVNSRPTRGIPRGRQTGCPIVVQVRAPFQRSSD